MLLFFNIYSKYKNIQTCETINILLRISCNKLTSRYSLNHRSGIYFPLNIFAGADYQYEISFVPLITLFLFCIIRAQKQHDFLLKYYCKNKLTSFNLTLNISAQKQNDFLFIYCSKHKLFSLNDI